MDDFLTFISSLLERLCRGSSLRAETSTQAHGNLSADVHDHPASLLNGSGDPSQKASIVNGSGDPSQKASIVNGSGDPSQKASIVNGSGDPSQKASIVNGSGDPSQKASIVNGSGDHTYVGGSAAPPLHQDEKKFDIFINHRGTDTKKRFVTTLERVLKEKQYTPFVDRSMAKGKHAFEEIDAAIQNAQVHLAVFSPGYAQSKYCLDELVAILKCQANNPSSVIVIPVFFDLEPGRLRTPDFAGNPFQEAFRVHMEKVKIGRFSKEHIEGWKKALDDAANFTGFDLAECAGDTNELIIKIVDRVQELISPGGRMREVLEPTVGVQVLLDGRLKELEEMGANVAILGICGMGGIGKTTLAQEIYNHYSSKRTFQHQTFLEIGDARDVSHLRKQALRELLNKKEKNLVEGYVKRFESLAGVRVLVVIDNISNPAHFKQLVPNMRKLGGGSRIILTSRERNTLRAVMNEAPDFASYLHEMKELNPADSCELFCLHAFENKELPRRADDVFRHLALKVIELCGGLPLALKIIGKHLKPSAKEVWEEATKYMRELIEVKASTSDSIIGVLSISYKGLATSSDKMMFLDVACQMVGSLEEDAIDIWKSCEPCRTRYCMTSKMVHGSLQILKDKSLVEVDKDKRLTMHDLLREMGRKMVIDEPNPQPWHLWDPLEAKEVLKESEGRKETRGLSLVGLQADEVVDALGFQTMSEIHLLQLDGVRIEGDFSHMPKKIRWLQWRSSFLPNLPSQLKLQNLVILDLSNSSTLTRLWSDGDTQVPRLLKTLHLQNCTALEEIPESIEFLILLRTLNLQGCKSLKHLPGSLGKLQGLHDLNLNECENLESLPDGMVNLSNLRTFSMNGCKKIAQLPEDFGDLGAKLVLFSAQDASSLTCLPGSFSRLSCLEELRLSNCQSLSELPKSVKGLVKLRVIHLHGTGLRQLPDDFGDLGSLVELHITQCNSLQGLPESFGDLGSLVELHITQCNSLQGLPESFGDLGSLVELHITQCNSLQGLPESFGKLALLKILSLAKSRKFRKFSSNFGQLQSLANLNLEACPIEDGDLPISFGGLRTLRNLLMQQNKMTMLPASFRDLTSLARLDMRDSPDLVDVDALPAFIEELELGDCPKLIAVNLVEKLTKLRKLILCNCTGLTEVHGLESMKDLQEINVSGCSSLSSLDENLLFKTAVVKGCYLSGSGVCLKYNNDWSQTGAPSSQVVSYYDHAFGFVENAMTRKISSIQDANEVCVESKISIKDPETVVEAVVITAVAHDQGWSDYHHLHGQYNGYCYFEAHIVRADGEVPVFVSLLFNLRHADCQDQVYVCTLRKSHPLVERLRDGDKICVIARSIYREWRITAMQGSIYVAYNKPNLGSRSGALGDLYLKDGASNKFRSNRLPRHVRQAFTVPVEQNFDAVRDGVPAPISQGIGRVVGRPDSFVPTNPGIFGIHLVGSHFDRTCDICSTLIRSQRGWHCNTCDDFDMCQTCYTNPDNATLELPPPHQSDHPMSVFESPDPTANGPIWMPADGVDELNWGYLVYEYPNVRWIETFDLVC